MDHFQKLKIKCFVDAHLFNELLKKLIETKKQITPKFSQSLISTKIGFKAKSHLSDILSGRRRFPEDKLDSLAQIFLLNNQEQFLLRLFYQLEYSSQDEKEKIFIKIAKTKQYLISDVYFHSSPMAKSVIAADIFFYMLKIQKEPTEYELLHVFAFHGEDNIKRELLLLENFKVIQKYDRHYKLISCTFMELLGYDTHETLKESFKSAAHNIDQWFKNTGDNLFGVSMFSTTYDDFIIGLKDFKNVCFQTLLALEEIDEPDMLLRINFALYPIGKKK